MEFLDNRNGGVEMISRKRYTVLMLVALICCFGVLGAAHAQDGDADRGIVLPLSPWALAAMGIALACAGGFVVWRHRKVSVR